MRTAEIISLLKEYMLFGIIALILVGILFLIGYKLIYRKFMKGAKEIEKKKLILYCISIIYGVILLGAVFLNRNSLYGSLNLQLFSSYKEAYNTMQLSLFRNIILNILLFTPLGFLLPIYSDKLKKAYKIIGIGFAVTLLIEIIQYITKLGIFELDDILNNTLGTLIGYAVFMTYKNKEDKKKIIKYCIPIAIIPIIFLGIFIKYQTQELGNLPWQYSQKVNMSKVEIENVADLQKERTTQNIYYKKELTKKETQQIAKSIFKKIGTLINEHETDIYEDTAIYWSTNREYTIWVNFKDGTYTYTDFSIHEKGEEDKIIEKQGATNEEVRNALADMGIEVPENAEFKEQEKGQYNFKVDMEEEDFIINGTLSCTYYEDGKIRRITNNIVKYEKAKEKEIISEQEAYEDILKGKFSYVEHGYGKLKKLTIKNVTLEYTLDTKGYYVPIYTFEAIANTQQIQINIKAIK